MVKKLLAVILSVLLSLAGCERYTDDAAKYGQVASYIDFPDYFPVSVENYEVNRYAYRLYSYMDICYEIFLDISVEQEEMARLLADAKEKRTIFTEIEANYAKGYYELSFADIFSTYGAEAETIGEADIEKIVYDPDSGHMVFVRIYAVDAGMYPVDELAYFERFQIKAAEYMKNAG